MVERGVPKSLLTAHTLVDDLLMSSEGRGPLMYSFKSKSIQSADWSPLKASCFEALRRLFPELDVTDIISSKLFTDSTGGHKLACNPAKYAADIKARSPIKVCVASRSCLFCGLNSFDFLRACFSAAAMYPQRVSRAIFRVGG